MSVKKQIIFATGNKGKIREIMNILSDPTLTVLSMKEAGLSCEPEENGSCFEENALIKARAVAERIQMVRDGRAAASELFDPSAETYVLSDDSGLVIDALGGEPGVHSARFMGYDTDYNLKMGALLEQMKDVPDDKRTARFTAAVAAVLPDGKEHVVTGHMEGVIAHEIKGENGFGYDPFFYLPEYGKTSAEISPEEKNLISHRGKALRAMTEYLFGK